MSIEKQVKFFSDLIEGDLQKFRKQLHDTNEVTVILPKLSSAEDIIKNSTIKYLKKTGFLSEVYRTARTNKVDAKGKRIETKGVKYPKDPYKVADSEVNTQLVDALNKIDYGRIARRILMSDKMASAYYTNEFKTKITFRGGKAHFIESSGTGYESADGITARRTYRQKAEREMVKASVILTLRQIAKAMRKAGASDIKGKRGMSLTGDTGVEIGRYKRTGTKTTPNLPNSKSIGFDVVGAHKEATTALMHVAKKASEAFHSDKLFTVLPPNDLGGIALDTRTRLRNHFLKMKINNKTIDDYLNDDTLNTINIEIELATHKENSQVNQRDKNSMNKFLGDLETDMLNSLSENFGEQKNSQAYLQTKASKKTFRKRNC